MKRFVNTGFFHNNLVEDSIKPKGASVSARLSLNFYTKKKDFYNFNLYYLFISTRLDLYAGVPYFATKTTFSRLTSFPTYW